MVVEVTISIEVKQIKLSVHLSASECGRDATGSHTASLISSLCSSLSSLKTLDSFSMLDLGPNAPCCGWGAPEDCANW